MKIAKVNVPVIQFEGSEQTVTLERMYIVTKEEFTQQILAHRSALYYISYGLLKNREDQDDAVQECIHKALRKRETLKEDKYFKTWITRILIHECYNVLRRKKREIPVEEIYVSVPETADYGVFQAVMQLEDKLRLPIILYYLEDYTTKEVAKILNAPESTIKSRLQKARRLLGQMMDGEEVFA